MRQQNLRGRQATSEAQSFGTYVGRRSDTDDERAFRGRSRLHRRTVGVDDVARHHDRDMVAGQLNAAAIADA